MSAPEMVAFDLCGPLPSGTTLLEASAGTGKTWTIAALYLRLVLGHGRAEALLPAQILVMTFTRAATRELSDRIRHRLLDAAARHRWGLDGGGTVEVADLGDALLIVEDAT